MLELFLKKYLWTANLALLLAAAWLSAKTVNAIAGSLIRPTPSIDAAALSGATASPPATAPLDTGRFFALIGQTPPAPDTSGDPGNQGPTSPQNCNDPAAAATRTSLRAQLVAAILAERPQWSIATITDLSSRETKIYGVGDQLLGAKLIGIRRIRDELDTTGSGFKVAALFCNNGTKEFLDFDGGEGGGSPSTPNLGVHPLPGPPGGPGSGASMEGVKKVADNRYEIQRSVIDSNLSNLNAIATQARIVPSFKNGVSNGFKLFSIQPKSLYASIGIENGDVIQKINGYEINSPDKALEIYQKLRESSHVTLEIERNGQAIRKEYNISSQ